jgi:hypothetical protein
VFAIIATIPREAMTNIFNAISMAIAVVEAHGPIWCFYYLSKPDWNSHENEHKTQKGKHRKNRKKSLRS